MYIPYGRQWIDEDDINAVVEALKSDFLTTGPKIKAFEDAICDYLGVKYAVAVSNGTAALHAACFAAGIESGDEVITSPITFAASSNAVLYQGGKPVFADIDLETYNIDPMAIKINISKKTKAIIPVHFSGQPCNMDEIIEVAKANNLIVIEDGAHVLGADYKGRKVGCLGDMMTISFHPVKHITTGEGGVIVTNDETFYKKLLLFRTHGITKDYHDLKHQDEPWYYEQQALGYNYRITDIQCALGISQLKKIDDFVDKRRLIASKYDQAFSTLKGIDTPYQAENTRSSYHLYVIKINHHLTCNRTLFFNELRQAGLGVNVHYIPVYFHPFYRDLGYKKGLCPNAETTYENIISIPVFPKMTNEEIEYVIKAVTDLHNKYLRS